MGEFIKNIRASIKMVLFVVSVSLYLVSAAIFYPLTFVNPIFARKILIRIISFYSRVGLAFMGVHVKVKGSTQNIIGQFIVSNHTGYLDVLVMASQFRACFVTSLEMRNTPFLGQLCEMGGCLYVDRKSRENLANEVKMLTEALTKGLNVCVFPEGTSTNGSALMRFKRPLFSAAIDANCPVKIMCLNYERVNGVPVSTQNRDTIFWYGDMTFLAHLWSFFKNSRVDVELSVGEEICGVIDFTQLSLIAHERVEKLFRPIGSQEGHLASSAHWGLDVSSMSSSSK